VVFQRGPVFALTEIFCALIKILAQIRAKAITKLSPLITQKKLMERIALAREYRVAEWLRDAYLELTIQKETLDFEELLLPAEPYSKLLNRNGETDSKKWKAISRDWETLARISQLQTKVATSLTTDRYCPCCECYGGSYYSTGLCKCRILAMVDGAFW
jgi:hypothetical protein